MLFITHNLPLVRSIAQRVAVLSQGSIVELGDTGQVLTDPQQPYTRQLTRRHPLAGDAAAELQRRRRRRHRPCAPAGQPAAGAYDQPGPRTHRSTVPTRAAGHPDHHGRPAGALGAAFPRQPGDAAPAMSRLAESGVVFDAAYTRQPAVLAGPGVAHDRPAALTHRRLRQRGASSAPTSRPSPTTCAAPATAPCWPARCTSAAPTSCTGSRSGSPPTSIPPTTAGRPTGTARTSGRSWYHDMSSVTRRRAVRARPTSWTSTTRWRSPPSGRCSATSASGDERPFCYVVSFSHPHDPFAIPRRWWDLYRDEDIPMPAVRLRRRPRCTRTSAGSAQVCAMNGVEITDEQIRAAPPRLLRRDLLRRRPHLPADRRRCATPAALDGTVVIVTSDHGEMLGERGALVQDELLRGRGAGAADRPRARLVRARPGGGRGVARWTCCRRWSASPHDGDPPASSAPLDGRSLLPHLSGRPRPRRGGRGVPGRGRDRADRHDPPRRA